MKVLMLSTDQKIFEYGSAVRERMISYGTIVEELHTVVFTRRNFQFPISNFQINSKFQISKNVWIYPTFTRLKSLYFWDAYKISGRIIRNWELEIRNSRDKILVTSQDSFETGLVGYLLKKKFDLPLQIQIHTDFLSPYFWRESFKNKLRVLLAKWLIKRADGLRVVSQRILSRLNLIYEVQPHKVAVLPILVDIEKIRTTSVKTDLHKKYPGYDFIILMTSRLTREKNIGLAIEAVKDLISSRAESRDYKNILLLIVGEGPGREALKLLITNYQLQNNIVIEPWTDDLISYYKTADMFLMTSNYEGYGMASVEAAAAGVPVVMTDVGVALGATFPVGDKEAAVAIIEDLIRNPLKRQELIKAQNEFFQKWPTKEQYLEQFKQSLIF